MCFTPRFNYTKGITWDDIPQLATRCHQHSMQVTAKEQSCHLVSVNNGNWDEDSTGLTKSTGPRGGSQVVVVACKSLRGPAQKA